jgi:hypothetical protein
MDCEGGRKIVRIEVRSDDFVASTGRSVPGPSPDSPLFCRDTEHSEHIASGVKPFQSLSRDRPSIRESISKFGVENRFDTSERARYRQSFSLEPTFTGDIISGSSITEQL